MVGNMLLSPVTSILVYNTTKRIDLITHDVHDVSEPHLSFNITLYRYFFLSFTFSLKKKINLILICLIL